MLLLLLLLLLLLVLLLLLLVLVQTEAFLFTVATQACSRDQCCIVDAVVALVGAARGLKAPKLTALTEPVACSGGAWSSKRAKPNGSVYGAYVKITR